MLVPQQALPQLVEPAGQVHVPLRQVLPTGQTLPHEPQLELLDCVFTHVPPHSLWPEGHAQTPDWHVMPPVHATPQEPQLELLFCRFTHEPKHEA